MNINRELLIEEIQKLKKDKNIAIMGHFYQSDEIQSVADYIGDSLAIAQQATKIKADIIVMCGVHFMAETIKILCPDKKVLLPDSKAGCSLADSCSYNDLLAFKKKYPEHKVISYVNTTAAVKALTDIVVTSSNAKQIVESFPKEAKLIFGPDRNLGSYINKITGRKMLLWDGCCEVHERFSADKLEVLKAEHPDAKVLAHPECREAVLNLSDVVGSTAGLLKFASTDSCQKFIVVTEPGVLYKMKIQNPTKQFIPAPSNFKTENVCEDMRLHTLEKLYLCMRDELNVVTVDEEIAKKAVLPIERMLEISAKLKL